VPTGPEPADDDIVLLRSRIPPRAAGQLLLDYLTQRFRYHDREHWRAELRAGRIELDGARAAPESTLAAGGRLLYRKPHREPPVDTAFAILHEDPDLLVLDKPAHLPMHGHGPFVRHTLIHLLRTERNHPEACLVHRLDRETSGVVVLARHAEARRNLERQFANGTVAKRYLAVVEGRPPTTFDCDAAIGHSTVSEISLRRSARSDARGPRPARTDFRVVERSEGRALLACTPHTGRTHQIRVHLEHCGYPLVGDKLYGRPDAHYLDFVRRVKAGADPRQPRGDEPTRHLLHSQRLALRHPTTDALIAFESPAPTEFGHWLLADQRHIDDDPHDAPPP